MSIIYNAENAVEMDYKVIRDNLTSFEATVIGLEEGEWGGTEIDEEGNVKPPKMFVEFICDDVKLVSSNVPVELPSTYKFRINPSQYKNSFWVGAFLKSATANNISLPDGIIGKRVVFTKVPFGEGKYVSTNFIIEKVIDGNAPSTDVDPEELINLAVGKTEAQFRQAAQLNTKWSGNTALITNIKLGKTTADYVASGVLVVGDDGVYQRA